MGEVGPSRSSRAVAEVFLPDRREGFKAYTCHRLDPSRKLWSVDMLSINYSLHACHREDVGSELISVKFQPGKPYGFGP